MLEEMKVMVIEVHMMTVRTILDGRRDEEEDRDWWEFWPVFCTLAIETLCWVREMDLLTKAWRVPYSCNYRLILFFSRIFSFLPSAFVFFRFPLGIFFVEDLISRGFISLRRIVFIITV